MLTTIEWARERLENCERLAAFRGHDRKGWLEDAAYFRAVIADLEALRLIREHAKRPAPGFESQDGG
jgi:hypothetical protein